MSKNNLLSKINSQYMLRNIINYIDYDNKIYTLKLFEHSKQFQQKLEITLFNFQEIFINNAGISLHKYLKSNNTKQKNILKRNLENDLKRLKLSENDMIQYLIHYYNKYFNKNEENIIDIYSPFFDLLSKEKKFNELFTIPLCIKDIKKYSTTKDYISAFEELNKTNLPYPILKICYSDIDDIQYLNDLKVNFNLIQKLKIEPEKMYNNEIFNSNSLFAIISSLPNIKDNLIYLDIKGTIIEDIKGGFFGNNHNLNDQEKLNEFKSLKVLKLSDFVFTNLLCLDITNLIELYLNDCKNITFKSEEDICKNLKKINFGASNEIKEPTKKIKAPELEEIQFYGEYCHIFDYSSLLKLKNLITEYCVIENYKNSPLEYISFERSSLKNEKENLKQLISIERLKKLKIKLSKINDNDIDNIKGENNSVEEIHLIWNNQENDCQIYNLQKKFPNVSKLIINAKNFYGNNLFSQLEIEENHNLKINKFEITAQNKMIKFCVQSFENLKYISLNIVNEIKNLKNALPFFNDNCKVIFNYLTYFEFINNAKTSDAKTQNLEILKNLYNNIDKMRNVRIFVFSCFSKGMDDAFYLELIKKIMSLRLTKIELKIQDDAIINYGNSYSKEELKQLCPNIFFGIQKILIYKLKVKPNKK